MHPILVSLLLFGQGPPIVFDDRPDAGVPPEARAQKPDVRPAEGPPRTLHAMTDGTIKTVRIRYFNRAAWASEAQAREYVAGFLADTTLEGFDFQIWSQMVGRPELECVVEFTDAYLEKLRPTGRPVQREGRLLIWNTESCFRDATGRWRFVTAFNYFHKAHPNGDRKLVRATTPLAAAVPGLPVGKWIVRFANGVAEACEIRADATATVVETPRSSGGKVTVEGNSFLIRYEDDRVERWTPVAKRMVVEHWFPGSQMGESRPELGVADRAR